MGGTWNSVKLERCYAPWTLRILGERGIGVIFVGQAAAPHRAEKYDPSELDPLRRLFPEANVYWNPTLIWIKGEKDSRIYPNDRPNYDRQP